jgi:RES domain-containing protein
VIYTSATLSLATLEYLVNLDSDLLPEDLVALSADIPSQIKIQSITRTDLPANWQMYPAPDTLQAIGTTWVATRQTVILSVPSVVIPEERNYLLNPAHPDFSQIHWNAPKPFRFDPRLHS